MLAAEEARPIVQSFCAAKHCSGGVIRREGKAAALTEVPVASDVQVDAILVKQRLDEVLDRGLNGHTIRGD